MKKVINRSITINKELSEKVDALRMELNQSFSGITSVAYEFYIDNHYKFVKKENTDNSGRGFELISNSNRKGDYAKLPKRGSNDSAGYDFYLPENVMLAPGESSGIIFTNIKAFMNKGEVLKLYIRSSIGIKKGIVLRNGTGIIDAKYYNNIENEGNIGIVLHNISNKTVYLEEGERIMQGVFQNFLESSNCNTDEERKGGFGSTGK